MPIPSQMRAGVPASPLAAETSGCWKDVVDQAALPRTRRQLVRRALARDERWRLGSRPDAAAWSRCRTACMSTGAVHSFDL